MALVYRQTKGEALTFAELDGNFEYFTGSHSVTGSLVVSGALVVTGSITPGDSTGTLGTVSKPWKDLYLSNSTLYFVSGSTTSSFSVNSSGSMSGSFTGSFGGTFSGSFNGTSSYVSQALSASYAVNATSASYFSGSSGGATFTGDVSFTSGANVDGLFVVAPVTDTSITGGVQVLRGENSPVNEMFLSLNCFGGGGRIVGVNTTNDTPSIFFMLHDSSTSASVMELRTVFNGGVSTAYITINTASLPSTEPSISGQLWMSGSSENSKFLMIKT